MPDPNCPTCKGLGGYPKCPTCQNAGGSSPATGSLPSHVYVVATGGFRIAIESEYPLPMEDVAAKAIERFIAIGAPALGVIMEITECSDRADPSDPTYVHTENQLRRVGRFIEANKQLSNP